MVPTTLASGAQGARWLMVRPIHAGCATHMVALNEAWAVLGDPGRRAAYDEGEGHAAQPPTR